MDKNGKEIMVKLLFCVLYVLFAVMGLTLIKLGAISETISIKIPIFNFGISKLTFLGIICYGISFCAYFGVLNCFDLGYIIPVLGGIVNIIIVIVAVLVLNETLTATMIVGAILIIIGIVIMNLGAVA